MIKQIISGGNTGADYGGLLAGETLGIPTGGWAPRGWRTEKGPNPELGTRFDLKEHAHSGYAHRTAANVEWGDGTVIFGPLYGGSKLTMECCLAFNKPWWNISLPLGSNSAENFLQWWLKENKIQVLNVAGKRESKYPGIEQTAKEFLIMALQPHLELFT